MLLPPAETYDALCATFRWQIPPHFNIANVCCDAWALRDPERTALIGFGADGTLTPTTYGQLAADSGRLATYLSAHGIRRGDRIALLLPQSVAAVTVHFAAYKIGAIVVPLAALFGADALAHRLTISGARGLVTDAAGLAKVRGIGAPTLPALDVILSVDGADGDAGDLRSAIADAAEIADPVATTPDDPALMIFTSGTTGLPKGALHGHRVLAGHIPGFQFTHTGFPQAGDRAWTPSDWAWAGGLLNCLLPSLMLGVPVVFGPFRPFDPDEAFALMGTAEVRNVFMPPTALRMLRAVQVPPRGLLRTIGAAGESLGRETYEWAASALGVPVNEFYGQTECNYVLGSSAALGVSRAGYIGRAIPGHTVGVLDEDGTPAAPGAAGEIAIHRDSPSMFLGYWNDTPATEAKFRGDWMMTGDMAEMDADGMVRFIGRNDDVIISSGYRIGPAEIEDCLATHPAVAASAVVGKPDALRTEIVKAFVALKDGYAASEVLADALRLHVRQRLSAAEYPREIAFVDNVPMTTSGKIIRRAFRDQT